MEHAAEPNDLERFVEAQEGVYDDVRAELRAGRKRSHWMWFVFPQLKGLGRSATAARYAIGSLDEARAYLAHPVLGRRLKECTQLVLDVDGRTLEDIFGGVDALKFRSSMTLFARAAPDEALFRAALAKYCNSKPDALTLELLAAADRP